MLRRVLREPLFHFLLLGLAIFLASVALRDSKSTEQPGEIVITSGVVEQITTAFTRTWNRPPGEQELNGLMEDYIKEEIFYREAVAMGLDRDDIIVRRRLAQKIDFLSEELNAVPEPGEQDLQRYLESNRQQFQIGTKISFTQIYVNTEKRGASAEADAQRILTQLIRNKNLDTGQVGDPFLIPDDHDSQSADEIARTFGSGFAAEVVKVKTDQWTGPLKSEYGLHLVLVRQKVEGRMPLLAEVKDAVKKEWIRVERAKAKQEFYRLLRARYTVRIEPAQTAQVPGKQ